MKKFLALMVVVMIGFAAAAVAGMGSQGYVGADDVGIAVLSPAGDMDFGFVDMVGAESVRVELFDMTSAPAVAIGWSAVGLSAFGAARIIAERVGVGGAGCDRPAEGEHIMKRSHMRLTA